MRQWQSTLCYVVILVWPGKNARLESSPLTGINTIIREYIGRSVHDTTVPPPTTVVDYSETEVGTLPTVKTKSKIFLRGKSVKVNETVRDSESVEFFTSTEGAELFSTENELDSKSKHGHHGPDAYPVVHAGLPLDLAVNPVPLYRSEHELAFNVTWEPPRDTPVRGYSLEVHSMTETTDCRSNMCYEYNIPGNSKWKVVPEFPSPIPEGCSVRPGCAYRVRLIAHPWDGHTSANLDVALDECVAGVCSCGHSRRLPTPKVSARTISVRGDLYVNVTWSLPEPPEPLRLPPRLMKSFYFVSLGKQMVTDAHPSPWYAHTISRKVNTTGFVAVPESNRWLLLPVVERSGERSGKRSNERGGERGEKVGGRNVMLDLKLLARVSLIDERQCVGPSGNATAYDPDDYTVPSDTSVRTYLLWAIFGGTVIITMTVLLAVGARAIKRILKAFRPLSGAPLQPLSHRPPWFPLQLQLCAPGFGLDISVSNTADFPARPSLFEVDRTNIHNIASTSTSTGQSSGKQMCSPAPSDAMSFPGKLAERIEPLTLTAYNPEGPL